MRQTNTQLPLAGTRPTVARLVRPPCYIKLINPIPQNVFFENGHTYWQEDEFVFDITGAQFWWIANGKAILATVEDVVAHKSCAKCKNKECSHKRQHTVNDEQP